MTDLPPYEHDLPDDAETPARLRKRLEAILPSVIKRTVSTGVGAAQMTEDVIRGVVGDVKLPREAVAYIAEMADHTRREIVRVAAREFREFLETANLTEEIARLLTTVSFEVRTEIRFIPNDQALKPNVRSSVRMKGPSGEPVDREDGTAPDAASGLAEALDDIIRSSASEVLERVLRRGPRREDDARESSQTAASTEDAAAQGGPAESCASVTSDEAGEAAKASPGTRRKRRVRRDSADQPS
jgi:hypothetical protein